MTKVDTAFLSISNLNLWFGIKISRPLSIADVSDLIPLRWTYFRDNWEFIYPSLVKKIPSYIYPDQLKSQIDSLGSFIIAQRNNAIQTTNPFSKSSILQQYYSVWQSIDLSSIPLTRQESDLITNKINSVSKYIKTDFLKIRQDIVNARDEITDIIGLQDSTYNAVYSRSSQKQLRNVKISDITDMQTFHEAINSLDYILANINGLSTINVDPFALARANANNPDIVIPTGNSGSYVRMFYGESLSSLAYRFLGDPDRWVEIAIANGLKSPYVDEIGQTINLIVNGNGNQINISALDNFGHKNKDKIYINQVIFIQSSIEKTPNQRKIISIQEVPVSGELIIQVDGDSTMGNYLVSDNAYIRVYLPNTINSNFFVLIPSANIIANQLPTHNTPVLLANQQDNQLMGIDLAIDNNNDLVFYPSGDIQYSYGLGNAVQAMQLKLQNEQGQLPRHPTFGLPSVIGSAQPKEVIKDTLVVGITDMVAADPRFDRIETIDVKINKQNTGMNTASVSLVVRMAGSGTLVPIGFTVNTG